MGVALELMAGRVVVVLVAVWVDLLVVVLVVVWVDLVVVVLVAVWEVVDGKG